jgi:serine/threonine-protein kinase
MEYVDGPSLFDLLQRRPGRRLGLADAIRTAIHIGAGIQHLHQCGFLYLDLKPANLMLRSQVPVLVDFDTACRIKPGKCRGNRLGTAPYMAPEQARGEPLTTATDIYGLGAVLYEMVTGRWPFESVFSGDEERVGEERRYPQLGTEPPSPPRRWNPEIPYSLDDLITRALAAAPADRPPSMHAFLLALSAELDETTALWPDGVQAERRRGSRLESDAVVIAEGLD